MASFALFVAESASKPWLDFASTLVWQAIVAAVLFFFRTQVADLLKRIASFKAAGTEFSFQAPTPEAKTLTAAHVTAVAAADPEGFLEASDIPVVVENSRLLQDGETISRTVQLFATPKQRTWLVATDRRLFYVLDDDATRARDQLIQRVQDFDEVSQVKAEQEDALTGVVTIGDGNLWYYSTSLHPSPTRLEKLIRSMVGRRT